MNLYWRRGILYRLRPGFSFSRSGRYLLLGRIGVQW